MSDSITIDHFAGVKILVGRIISAEAITGSEKMLHLTLNVGEEERTILSGIAKYYTPEDLVNTSCLIVGNLEPRAMLGFESNGMILCTSHTDSFGSSVVRIISPPSDVPPGSLVS